MRAENGWFFREALPVLIALTAACLRRMRNCLLLFLVLAVATERAGCRGFFMFNLGKIFGVAALLAFAGVAGSLRGEGNAAETFRPMLIVTAQPAYADMFARTLDGMGVNYSQVTRAFLKQRLQVLVFSAGQSLDGNGEMNVDFDVEVRRPDGSVERLANQVVRRGKVPSSDSLVFPESQLAYWEEAESRVGSHSLIVRVRDRVAGVQKELRHVFDVAKFEAPELPEGFERNAWLIGYYTKPAPEFALPALGLFFGDMKPQLLDGAMSVVLNFYDQLLRDNAWMVPFFAGAYDEAEGLSRVGLQFVTGYFLRGEKERPEWCGEVLWEDSAAVREFAWTKISETVPQSSQELDILWGRFFATGRFEWVERIASTIEYGDYPGKPEGDNALLKISHDAVLRSALRSMEGNARVHLLVKGYAGFLVRTGKWAKEQRALLARAVGVPES